MTRLSANLLMLVAGLVWGAGFIAQQTAMDDIGPFLFMALRFPLAALAILPFVIKETKAARIEGGSRVRPPLNIGDYLGIAVVGLVFFIAMAMQQVGLLTTSVTNAGVLTGLYVVLVPILALVLFKQPQPIIIWPCAVAAFIGIWMLGGGGLAALSQGDWLVLIGAIFAAFHVIAIGVVVTRTRRPATLACAQFAISGVIAWVGFAIARATDWSLEPPIALETILAAAPEILYAALFAGALAFTIMAVCQQYTSASSAAVLLSSEALFAALGGALILDERLTALGYAGCALMFAAIVIVSFSSAEAEEATAKG